jgi:hypothetical protein
MAEWTGGSRVGEEVVEWVDPVSSTVVARIRRQSPDTLVVEGGADLRVWYRVATKAARPAVPGPLPALNLEWRRRSGLPAPVTWAQGGNAFAEEGRWIEIPLQAGITPGRTSLAAADLDSGWGAAIEIAAELLSPAVGREATPARP